GANLQISSARAIMMGMSTINNRLAYVGGLRGATTPTDHLAFNQLIRNDRDLIVGLTDDSGYYSARTDSGCTVIGYFRDLDAGGIWYPADGHTQDEVDSCTDCVDSNINYAGDNPLQESREVMFSALVLNAPVVMSRYQGEFHGCIITEFPLF